MPRPQPPAAQGAPAPRQSSHGVVFAVLGASALGVVTLGAAVLALTHRDAPDASARPTGGTPVSTGARPASSVVAAEPIQAPAIAVRENFAPLVADIDGDAIADVVVAIATTDADRSEHYALFSGRDGHELSRTPTIVDQNGALTAVLGRRLISASRAGQLISYGLADGSQQWTTALGARATAFCSANSGETLIVATDERRQLAIDLTTGRQSETKSACSAPIARADLAGDPRDRRDYAAPPGSESYHCGGVTVMGSENYTVSDQCLVRAHIDTDRLDGLIGHRLWKVGPGWLVFGIRNPGARVPMLGLIDKGRLSWKATLPLDNPLEAQEGSPRYAGLAANLIVAAYATEKASRQFLTAFAVTDGTRRWHVALPESARNLSALVTSETRVFIRAREQLLIVDAGDGKLLAQVGKDS